MKPILFAFLCLGLVIGCDFTKRRESKDVKIQGTSKEWTVETGGAVNYAAFVSRTRIPAETKLGIQIEKIGTEGDLTLSLWDGQTRKTVRTWHQDTLTETQVLDLELPESSRYALEIGGQNFWKEPIAVSNEGDGTSLLSFDSGWRIRVKLVRKSL